MYIRCSRIFGCEPPSFDSGGTGDGGTRIFRTFIYLVSISIYPCVFTYFNTYITTRKRIIYRIKDIRIE